MRIGLMIKYGPLREINSSKKSGSFSLSHGYRNLLGVPKSCDNVIDHPFSFFAFPLTHH